MYYKVYYQTVNECMFVHRTSELVALMAISSTLFLFLHTRELHTKLRQMETRVQADDLTANQVSGMWTRITVQELKIILPNSLNKCYIKYLQKLSAPHDTNRTVIVNMIKL